MKRLNGCIQDSFRKVRIGQNKNNDEVDDLFNKRRLLKNKSDDESIEELKKVEEELAERCAKDNYDKINEEIAGIELGNYGS